MCRSLADLCLEELWQLFPIVLTAHDTRWALWYAEEKRRLQTVLPAEQTVRISHIGSTAVPDIWAKPIVDILVEVLPSVDFQMLRSILEQAGYCCMSKNEQRMSWNKGYTENGFAEKVFHLHIRRCGDNDELYFRDYLTEHADIARKYEQLKLRLWKPYEHDRDGYTAQKTAFVKHYTQEAKRLFPNRYA